MEPLLNNLIKAIGWSILHSLWQGAIIYGLLLLLVMALPKLQSKLKHNLAYGAICLIFACFVITFFSIFKIPVAGSTPGTNLTLSTTYYQYMNTLPLQISHQAEYFLPYVVVFYSLGLIFQLFILGAGYKKMLELKKGTHFNVPAEWKASFNELVLQLNLRQAINFHLSDKINVPLVIGFFKPVVLFPVALVSQLDMDQVEAILIHELSHIRRNDYLLNLIKTAIETLLFFNPFIWLSGRFINIEREHACDDLVLKFTGSPMTYAHALLKLEILKDKSAPAFSMAASGKNQHLYQRIKRITNMKTNYMNVRQQLLAITLIVATVVSLAWVKPSKAEKVNQKAGSQKQIEVAGIPIQKAPEAPEKPLAPKLLVNVTVPVAPAAQVAVIPPLPPRPSAALPCPDKHKVCQDTTKKKLKYTIVTVDEKGNKKEYHSVKEMPENVRDEVIKETFKTDLGQAFKLPIDSIVNSSVAFLKSPEWKRSMDEIRTNAQSAALYFKSADWKRQQADIRKHTADIQRYFNSKDWKKQQEKIRKDAAEMGRKMSQEIQQQIDRAEQMNKKAQKEKEAAEKEAVENKP
uniref:M56 family metallopeptidase n=1 Tax=Pedobacter schmidteae TaxID=2201271 RepID=UPI000EB2F048|nr:M56 family metallopeptidase [Pedobacter schmidteae]